MESALGLYAILVGFEEDPDIFQGIEGVVLPSGSSYGLRMNSNHYDDLRDILDEEEDQLALFVTPI